MSTSTKKSKRVTIASENEVKYYNPSPNPEWKKQLPRHRTPNGLRLTKPKVKKFVKSLVKDTVVEVSDLVMYMVTRSNKSHSPMSSNCISHVLSGIVMYTLFRMWQDDVQDVEDMIGQNIPENVIKQTYNEAMEIAIDQPVIRNTLTNVPNVTSKTLHRMLDSLAALGGDLIEQQIMLIASQ